MVLTEEKKSFRKTYNKRAYKSFRKFGYYKDCDLIGFHGQTIYHNSSTQKSIQMDKPSALANKFKGHNI